METASAAGSPSATAAAPAAAAAKPAATVTDSVPLPGVGSPNKRASQAVRFADTYASSEGGQGGSLDIQMNPIARGSTSGDGGRTSSSGGADGSNDSGSEGKRESRGRTRSTMQGASVGESLMICSQDCSRTCRSRKIEDFSKLCYHLNSTSLFWLIVTSLCFLEPIVCSLRQPATMSHKELSSNLVAQCLVLALSTVFLILQGFAVLYTRNRDKSPSLLESGGGVAGSRVSNNKRASAALRLSLLQQRMQSEVEASVFAQLFSIFTTGALMLESACILGGWIFIYTRPGIAALRCLRLLRVLYFHDLPCEILYKMEKAWYWKSEVVVPCTNIKVQLSNPFSFLEFQLLERACKFASGSLERLGTEMFWLTKATKGGFVLMALLGAISSIMGMAVYNEVYDDPLLSDPDSRTSCISNAMCMIVLLRLTFFDGTGLDFLTNLSINHKFLFACVIVYLCVTAFGIFNGLIGVFGGIFQKQSEKSFQINHYETPRTGYSQEYIEHRVASHGGDCAPGKSKLIRGDVVVYEATFTPTDKLASTRVQGEFNGLVGEIVDIEEHKKPREILTIKANRKQSVVAQDLYRDDDDETRGLQLPPYGITYTVRFDNRTTHEKFRVEFQKSDLNPEPNSTLLHFLKYKAESSSTGGSSSEIRQSSDYQPLAGRLRLLPVTVATEERVCNLEEQLLGRSLEPSPPPQQQQQELDADEKRRLVTLEAQIKEINTKLDLLLARFH